MKQICCYGGILTQVSDEDFGYLCGFHWSVRNDGYVQTQINKKIVLMHRVIVLDLMKLIIPKGMEIDHEDKIKIHNWRENLRIVTHSRNEHNKGVRRNNSLGVKGVRWFKRDKKYHARIMIDGKTIHLGYFNTLEEAAEARVAAEIKYGVN